MEYTHIEPIRKLLKKCRRVYVVGGALRDEALGIKVKDVDVVIHEDPSKVLDAGFFPLDQERGIYRCLWEGMTIDVARMQGESIEDDLKRRDYTINAVAYELNLKKFIDPLGGLKDAELGILRAVSEDNIKDDPVRILRGIRLWLWLPLKMEEKTRHMLKSNANLLRLTAPERIKEEIVKITAHPLSHKAVFEMERLGIIDEIFPELARSRGLFQGKFYGVDLKGHLLFTYRCCEHLINHIKYFFPEEELNAPLKQETEKGVEKRQILKLSALLHDVAKPHTFKIRNDQYTFWGHDKLGAEIAENALKRLKFSSKSAKLVRTLVENHMRLHLLARAGEISQKAKGRFFRHLKEDGVLTVYLSLSDSLSSSGHLGFFYLLRYAEEMLAFYLDFIKEEKLQKPLLSGYDVMDILNIKPGPMVGKVLSELLEAQTEGRVKTKEEAIKFVKEVFRDGKGRDSLH